MPCDACPEYIMRPEVNLFSECGALLWYITNAGLDTVF